MDNYKCPFLPTVTSTNMNVHVDIFVYIYTFVFGGQSELNKRLTLCVCAYARAAYVLVIRGVFMGAGQREPSGVFALCLYVWRHGLLLSLSTGRAGWPMSMRYAYCTPHSASASITGTSQSGFLYRL